MLTRRKLLALMSAFASRLFYSPAPASAAADGETGKWSPLAIGAGGYITGHGISNDGTTLVCRTDIYGMLYLGPPHFEMESA
jgi:hypothetical protein